MLRLRWAGAALVVTLAVALLAACSEDDPEPRIDSEPTASESTTAVTATPSLTATPTSARSPIDTVKEWIAAQNTALRTGDTSGLRALSAPACQGCSDYPDGIEKIYNAGGHFEGGEWTFVRGKIEDDSEDPVKVDVGVRIAGGTTVTESGAAPTNYGPESRLMVFELSRASGTWLISLIGFLS